MMLLLQFLMDQAFIFFLKKIMKWIPDLTGEKIEK